MYTNEEVVMQPIAVIVMTCCLVAFADAGDIVVQKVQGDVRVRHGITEVWMKAKPGDVLRPNDTMKTGKGASAVISAPVETSSPAGSRNISLPPEVMVDMSDLRDLSQEELMLKLTMEKVRSSSYEWKNNDLRLPNAAVVRGPDRTPSTRLSENAVEEGVFQLNGTRVLFANRFYSTCALKAVEVLRRFPELEAEVDHRLMVAEALEKSNLRGEALNEYVALSLREDLNPDERSIVQDRIARLKKQGGG